MNNEINVAYLLLGSNMGNRLGLLDQARELIAAQTGEIIAASSIYETAAWGNTELAPHLNQALKIECKIDSLSLLDQLQEIENSLGRMRQEKWGERTMDIDIIFFNQAAINHPRLIIPHPLFSERGFALAPMADIAKDYIHPTLKKTVAELKDECKDMLSVAVFLEQ